MPTAEKSLRVLIVDDNRDGADLLGLLVEHLGNQVHVTYGGRQALEVVTAFRPDVMLVDLIMPEMNGCDLVRRVRQIPALAHTKIFAVTGRKDDENTAMALKSGCEAILVKPIELSDIKSALAAVTTSATPDGAAPAIAYWGGTPAQERTRLKDAHASRV